jgi:hypothetical protein
MIVFIIAQYCDLSSAAPVSRRPRGRWMVGVSMLHGIAPKRPGPPGVFNVSTFRAALQPLLPHTTEKPSTLLPVSDSLGDSDNIIRKNILVQYCTSTSDDDNLNASLRRQRSREYCPRYRTRSAKGKSGFRASEDFKITIEAHPRSSQTRVVHLSL